MVANSPSNADIQEKYCFISALTKLASLAEVCEPSAEGKWVLYALREVTPLLPRDRGLQFKAYHIMSSARSGLEHVDPSFSGLPTQNDFLDTLFATPQKAENTSTVDHAIPEDEVTPEDECLFPPIWLLPDLPSVVSFALERLAVFSSKHGELGYV